MNIQEQIAEKMKFSSFGMVVLRHEVCHESCILIDKTPASVARVMRAIENGHVFVGVFSFCFDGLENQLVQALLDLYEQPVDDAKASTVQDVMSKMRVKYPDNGRSMRHLLQQFCMYGFARSKM